MDDFPPIHPGEHLKEDFMVPNELSANRLAQAIGVPTNRITQIVAGRRNITADTALRLAAHFGTSPEFWLSLQAHHDLQVAVDEAVRAKDKMSPKFRALMATGA